MALFESTDLSGLDLSFQQLAKVPNDIITDMLVAEADVVEPAQVQSAKTTGASPHGILASKIKRAVKKGKDGLPYIDIYPAGTYRVSKNGNKTRAAEVAFIREYGIASRGIPATQFMSRANRATADRAIAAARNVYDKFIDSLGF